MSDKFYIISGMVVCICCCIFALASILIYFKLNKESDDKNKESENKKSKKPSKSKTTDSTTLPAVIPTTSPPTSPPIAILTTLPPTSPPIKILTTPPEPELKSITFFNKTFPNDTITDLSNTTDVTNKEIILGSLNDTLNGGLINSITYSMQTTDQNWGGLQGSYVKLFLRFKYSTQVDVPITEILWCSTNDKGRTMSYNQTVLTPLDIKTPNKGVDVILILYNLYPGFESIVTKLVLKIEGTHKYFLIKEMYNIKYPKLN